jgi:selenocysteine lyase/cysteine desulfurase
MLSFAELRRREFARLDAQGHAYLDYTGSALYATSQLRAHHALLDQGLYGNPHSEHEPSLASTRLLDHARAKVLQFLDADSSTHAVVFVANTTAAIKLVAESYPFTPESECVLSLDNHNSMNGVREYARRAGARIRVLPLDDEMRLAGTHPQSSILNPQSGPILNPQSRARGLLAFPAQSNFSGVRHPLSLVTRAKKAGYDVLLDIAAYAPSHAISLRECPADFVALSFYKLFGYPTGLGALVARRQSLEKLRRPWFAGGTVLYASAGADTHRLREGHEGFEDGTPDFLSVAALPAGFALLEEVGMPRLSAHVTRLTARLLDGLSSLPHVRVYGPRDTTDRGGAVAFNVRGVPYWIVEKVARAAGVSLRGGCFCNPGASEAAFGLDPDSLSTCLETLGADFTVERFSACTGTAVGALRASVGLANNEEDIDRALEVIAGFAARAATG